MSEAASQGEATRLVFQYGSNCLDSQINGKDRLKGDARFVSVAETVDDFELAFTVFSRGRHCAAADLVPTQGARAWGVLYEIPVSLITTETAKARNRRSLDAIEGEGKNYERKEIRVRKPDGAIVTAITYVVKAPRSDLKTDSEYVRCIIAGFRERGIPADYTEKVKRLAIANNPAIAADIERL